MNIKTQMQNVDHTEIKKFATIAKLWWDMEGELKTLHRINPLRFEYIARCAYSLFGKKVLDVGCGGGILAEIMAREGAQVTGLDMESVSLQVARLHALENNLNIQYVQGTVESHAEVNAGSYDVITCMEMLEHVPDPQSVVSACARLVKPGGHVFFSTIHRNLTSWFLMIFIAEYFLNMVPRGTHDVKKFIRPSELLSWVDDTLLEANQIRGLHYNILKDCFTLGPTIKANYILHTQRDIYPETRMI